MQCYICNGEMERIKKDVEATWKGRTVIFRGMEAWVCQSCGEEAYEPDDARLMQGLIQGTLDRTETPEIMDVEEVADLLRVSNQTVYNLVRSGRLPATKIGREWRFSRDRILELIKGEAAAEQSVAMAARDGAQNSISARDMTIIQNPTQPVAIERPCSRISVKYTSLVQSMTASQPVGEKRSLSQCD